MADFGFCISSSSYASGVFGCSNPPHRQEEEISSRKLEAPFDGEILVGIMVPVTDRKLLMGKIWRMR